MPPQRPHQGAGRCGTLATRAEESADLLDTAGLPEVVTSLRATMGAPIRAARRAETALAPLEVQAVARHVTPSHSWQGGPRLSPSSTYGNSSPATPPAATDGLRDTLSCPPRGPPVVAALVAPLIKTAAEVLRRAWDSLRHHTTTGIHLRSAWWGRERLAATAWIPRLRLQTADTSCPR